MDNFTIPENFYFHGTSETDRFVYIQTPLLLIKDSVFSDMTDGAKIMYSLLLNRVGLSISNNMMDEQGRTYILYSQEELASDLGKSTKQIGRYYKELELFNLIERKRVLNQKWRIYVLNFQAVYEYLKSVESEKSEENQGVVTVSSPTGQKRLVQLDKNAHSDQTKTSSPTGQKCPLYIKNNNIENYNIENYPPTKQQEEGRVGRMDTTPKEESLFRDLDSGTLYPISYLKESMTDKEIRELLTYPHFKEEVKMFHLSQVERKDRAIEELKYLIDYDSLLVIRPNDTKEIDSLLEYMSDIITFEETVTFNGRHYESEIICRQFFRLNHFCIEYVLDEYKKIARGRGVMVPRKLYIKLLMSAPSQADVDLSATVTHDMAHWNDD